MKFKFITSEQELEAFCKTIADVEWLAVDTEFIREKTYYPNLCLVQIANEHQIACIDTIAIDELSSLKNLIYQPSITKILHSASQDLEIFVNLFASVPTPIFDTQIAASLLGYGEQVSYAHLVNEILGIKLDKSLSRTNWDRRPLSELELKYAVDDVKYLAKIYGILKNKLIDTERSHWAESEFISLSNLENYNVTPSNVWKMVKGAGKLNSNQLNILKHLAEWRELQAIKENKPRRWILTDKTLRILSMEQPTNSEELHQIEEFGHIQDNYVQDLLQTIAQAQQVPQHAWPNANSTGPLSKAQRNLVKQALELVRERADELNVAPSLLATRSIVEKLVRDKRKLDVLSNWKKDLIGNDLLKLIESSGIA